MRTTDIDFHIAEQKLKLVNSTGFSSSFITIWKGNVVHVFWNNVAGEVVQIWPNDVIAIEDMGTLNFIINNFYKLYYNNPLTNI
jgi:hypothetical protein